MSPTAVPGATFLSTTTITFLIRFLAVLSFVKSVSNILFSPIELVILALANKKDDGNVRGSMPTSRILFK